jgi:hypothetical protein
MTDDPAATAARATAAILASTYGTVLLGEVEAVLATRDTRQRTDRYLDSVSVASLIVAIATLAWAVYNDQRRLTPKLLPDSIARQVRITLREQDTALTLGTEHISEIIATEITRHAAPEGHPVADESGGSARRL